MLSGRRKTIGAFLCKAYSLFDSAVYSALEKEAKKLGWSGGGLEKYAPGMCIGGDRFGNYEGRLPRVKGRTYYECDIDTLGASKRGAKRIVYSDDGQIYYTDNHYESFTLIYGDDE